MRFVEHYVSQGREKNKESPCTRCITFKIICRELRFSAYSFRLVKYIFCTIPRVDDDDDIDEGDGDEGC